MARKGIINLKSLKEQASNYIRDVHWAHHVQENFLKKYYNRAESVVGKRE